MPASVTILGSTGSIGESALRVVSSFHDDYKVYGFSCKSSIELLEQQIEKFMPAVVAVEASDTQTGCKIDELKKRFPSIEFLSGSEGIVELARRPVDITLSAIVGAAGLRPSLAALDGSGRVALANKETLVMAGDIFMAMAREKGVELIPVDSEHSAVFSLLRNVSRDEVRRIVLTASGGSLRDVPLAGLAAVTPEEALAHPTWDMGNKITIDSATLMNKGLEVIEAHHLFNIDYDRISVIVHPESIVHSMVETVDGAIYAHMGVPDMALPILNAFTYPQKRENSFGLLDLEKAGALHFIPFDPERYPALDLCFHAGRTGGTMPAVLNAANEVAVETFLMKKILFTDIVKVVQMTMERCGVQQNPDINSIIEADRRAREISKRIIEKEL